MIDCSTIHHEQWTLDRRVYLSSGEGYPAVGVPIDENGYPGVNGSTDLANHLPSEQVKYRKGIQLGDKSKFSTFASGLGLLIGNDQTWSIPGIMNDKNLTALENF